MTIRRVLLLAFLLVSLVPSVVAMALAFRQTRDAMQGEIEDGVVRSAAWVSADFEGMLAERLLNATTWNHVEVMQDLKIGDVDKRLSAFLAEMKARYGGTYRELHAVDREGRVVASSDPAAIGGRRTAGEAWYAARLPGGDVSVMRPSPDRAARRLELRVPIASAFASGEIGELVLEVRWSSIEALLDQASGASRQVVVLDRDGRVVAASRDLRALGLDLGAQVPQWANGPAAAAIREAPGAPFVQGDVIVGHAAARVTDGFPDSGWTTLLVQSRDVALRPVQRMAWVFAALLGAAILATVAIAFWVAEFIARPVVALTRFTRDYLKPGRPATPPAAGPGEIGELYRSFVHLVDDLQRSQQALVDASRLAALGEVTALVAHEVRTPLGILRSSAQMLRSEPSISAEGAELLGIIESETGRLNRLVGSLLDTTRTRPPARTPTDVHALIEHACTLVAAQARERGVSIGFVPGATRAVADCDGEQVTQILLNLLMNGVQILPPGGRVDVATRNEGARLVIEVDDDGPGVPADLRGSLFEPFVFKREGGTGLGLAVVRQIARSHGGDASVDVGSRGGALFRVWLPLDNPEKA